MTGLIALLVLVTILAGCGLVQLARDLRSAHRAAWWQRRSHAQTRAERAAAQQEYNRRLERARQAEGSAYMQRRYRDDGFQVHKTDGTEDYTSIDDRWKDLDA